MYYYKLIDENGETIGVTSCDAYLSESEKQIEITEEEYNAFLEAMPEPEVPEPPEYVITDEEINAAYAEGVNEA